MLDGSGETKVCDESPRSCDRADMWAAAVRCDDIDVMYSVVGRDRGSKRSVFVDDGIGTGHRKNLRREILFDCESVENDAAGVD